jgi:heme o synthase
MNAKIIADQLCERATVPASSRSADRLAERWWSDFFELTKPRVMLLAVFTAVVGLISAHGQLDPLQALVAVLCIAAGAGAAGALNMWYDADIDAVMTRTAMRPIPRGSVSGLRRLSLDPALALSQSWFSLSLRTSPQRRYWPARFSIMWSCTPPG